MDAGASSEFRVPSSECPHGGGDSLVCHHSDDVHAWFELTYAQYLTVPRSILQAMPCGWQERFVALLEELDGTFDWLPKEGRYWCRLRDAEGRFVDDPLMEYRHPNRALIEALRRNGAA